MRILRLLPSSWRLLAGVAFAALLTASCGDDVTPTNPTGIPDVSGVWSGQYHIKSCTDTINGAPGTFCSSVTGTGTGTGTGTTATTQPLQLTLTQKDDQVSGTLVLSGWYVASIPVSGTIGRGGRLTLQGSTTWTETACPTTMGRFLLTSWVSDLNRTHDGMTGGEFAFSANKRLSACLFADLVVQVDTVDITRKSSTPTTTSGGAGS